MKHTILGYQQEQLINHGITIEAAYILRYLQDVQPVFEKRIIKGKEYFWVVQTQIVEEYPLVIKNIDIVKRHMKKLIEAGFIEKSPVQKDRKTVIDGKTVIIHGKFSYFRVTEKIAEILDYQPVRHTIGQNAPTPKGKMHYGDRAKCTDKDPSTNNPSTNNHKDDDDVPSPINQSIINQFCTKWTEITSKKIKLTQKQVIVLSRLIKTHGLETIIDAVDKIGDSDYLKLNIKPSKFLNDDTLIRIFNSEYDTHKTIEPHVNKTNTTLTSKNTQFTTTYSHNWDLDQLDDLAQEYLERNVYRDK